MSVELPMILIRVEPDLYPAAARRAASEGARVYRLLPTLETLLAQPGLARREPIRMPGSRRPFDPWALWNTHRRAMYTH